MNLVINIQNHKRYTIEETLNKIIKIIILLLELSIEWFESIPMTYDLPTQSLSNVYIKGSNNEIEAPIYDESWNNIAFLFTRPNYVK